LPKNILIIKGNDGGLPIWVISYLKGSYDSSEWEVETLSFDKAIVRGMLIVIFQRLI